MRQAIWDALPRSGDGSHAMFSGTCGALFFDDATIGADIGEENATSNIQTGDIMFTHYDAGTRHGHLNALSEIYWAYDRCCPPDHPEGQHGPALIANVFRADRGRHGTLLRDVAAAPLPDGFKRLEVRRLG